MVSDPALRERRSPLASWREEFAALPAAVRVEELPFMTKFDLRFEPEPDVVQAISEVLGIDAPVRPCTSASVGGVTVLWLGPKEWLVVTPGTGRELAERLRTVVAGRGAVVDVSGQTTTLRISGPRARDLLAHGCSIDLHPKVDRVGNCVQTHLAKAGVTIVTRDATGTDFWVLVRASFAGYLAEWLVDACVPHRRDPRWK